MLGRPLTATRVGTFDDVLSKERWAAVERAVERLSALDEFRACYVDEPSEALTGEAR